MQVFLILLALGMLKGRDLVCLAAGTACTMGAVMAVLKLKLVSGIDGWSGLVLGGTAAVAFFGGFMAAWALFERFRASNESAPR